MVWTSQCPGASGPGLGLSGWKALPRAGALARPGEARGTCSALTACAASTMNKATSSSGMWPSAASEALAVGQARRSAHSTEDPEDKLTVLLSVRPWNRPGQKSFRPGCTCTQGWGSRASVLGRPSFASGVQLGVPKLSGRGPSPRDSPVPACAWDTAAH